MADIPGEGFDVGAAFVSVTPEAPDFQGEVAAIVEETDIVVTVPVVPDGADFRAQLEEEVTAGDTVVAVPVVPDTAGFTLLLDKGIAESRTPVTVPVVPDAAGFAEKIDADAAAAGEEAAAAFREKFAAVAGEMDLTGYFTATESEAGAAGESAGATWRERFAAATASMEPLAGLAAETETEAAAAGEAAGLSFGERFTAVASRFQALPASARSALVGTAEADGAATGEGFLSKFSGVLSGGLPAMEVLLPSAFVAAAAVMANSFQSAMEKIHTQAGVGQSSIQGLSNSVLSLASQVGESPDSLSAALYHIESSFQSVGITGSKAMDLLRIAAEGARVGGSDLVDTTNALDAAIASGIGGVRNYGQAMGALNAIVGSGDMTMQDLTQAMSSGLMAVAKSYGQTLPEIGAALATFGDNNIRGAKAATDLRMAMQALLSPMKAGEDELHHLGLSMTDLGNTMEHHGLVAAIGEFVDRLKAAKVPVADWGRYVTDIFGKRAGAGIGVLIDQVDRLKGKLPDITRATQNFGNAWQATQRTTAQKLHEMEAGFQTLMIKIGSGLLPVLGDVFSAVAKALPSIEKFGSAFAQLASPPVKMFFAGLSAVLKPLVGPLKFIASAATSMASAWMMLAAIDPFVAMAAAVMKFRKQIEGVLGDVGGKQISGAFERTWKNVEHTFDSFVSFVARAWKSVEHTFDSFRSYVTGSFDSWWAGHGKELEKVWNAVWGAIASALKTAWGDITGTVSAGWQLVGPFLTTGLDVLKGVFKVAWAAITASVKVAWDTMTAVVKIGTSAITAVIKTAFDVIVGIFNVALDLITGHWSKAWNDAKATVIQVFNAIKAFFGSFWSAVSSLFTQDVHSIESMLSSAWNTIRSTVVNVFDTIRHDIASVWDGIVSDALGFISRIEGAISGLGSAIASIPGKALGLFGIHLATGGRIPGYGGGDRIPAMLEAGETVVDKVRSRILAPVFSAVGVPGYGGGGIVGDYGPIRRYAGGGAVTGWDGAAAGISSDNAASLLMALLQALTGQGGLSPIAGRGLPGSGGGSVEMNFYGTQWPTPEQQQAMSLMLTSAVSNA